MGGTRGRVSPDAAAHRTIGLAQPEEGSAMHGQIDSILNHVPAGSHNLIVTGRLVADNPDDLTTQVKEITADLTINGKTVKCSTNGNHGNGIYATWPPGTLWTMQASTDECGQATGNATAYDDHNGIVTRWSQPPTPPTIVVC